MSEIEVTNTISWTARLASEKARARRLVTSGRAIISQTIHETYIGQRGIVNYEAWDVVEQSPVTSQHYSPPGE